MPVLTNYSLFFSCGEEIFKFNDNVEIYLGKARSKDLYKLLNSKTHMGNNSGPTRWTKSFSLLCLIFKNILKAKWHLRETFKDPQILSYRKGRSEPNFKGQR